MKIELIHFGRNIGEKCDKSRRLTFEGGNHRGPGTRLHRHQRGVCPESISYQEDAKGKQVAAVV